LEQPEIDVMKNRHENGKIVDMGDQY